MEFEKLIRQTVNEAVNDAIERKEIKVIIAPHDYWLSGPDAMKVLGVEKTKFREIIKSGALKTKRSGYYKHSDLMNVEYKETRKL